MQKLNLSHKMFYDVTGKETVRRSKYVGSGSTSVKTAFWIS